MDFYRIEGGNALKGEYRVKGAKNSALPILAATVCRAGVHEIYGCPRIEDVFIMEEILRSLGAATHWEKDCLAVDTRNIEKTHVPEELMVKMRSSVFLLGSLIARCQEASVHQPGGCRIGSRPIDIHIKGLESLGIETVRDGDRISCRGVCRGGKVRLPYPSVGATENLMMAALSGSGRTVIENCAREPEIADLQGFLRTCGFDVQGGGTGTVQVQGMGTEKSSEHKDTMYFILEDRIEAATYMLAVAATGGHGVFMNIRAGFLGSFLEVLERMGVRVRSCADVVEIFAPVRLRSPGMIVTEPYPGFPTDCQPQLMSACSAAEGNTLIREEIFESRFTHKKELIKMGACIETCGKNAIIKGVPRLRGACTKALDLRGGSALVLAGLMAEGITTVEDIFHIDRGYEDLDKGIKSLGGLIERRTSD